MTAAATFSCASCNSLVTPEDLAQGLAVRVDGRLICANCVDELPGKAQLAINKLRALKGLSATTYRVEVPLHPDHARYTFTTAGNILGHRRALRTTGEFHAPPMPAGGPPPEPPRAPSSSTNQVPPPRRRPGVMITAAVAALVLLGAIAAAFAAPRHETTPHAVGHEATRADYPKDPGEAWLACGADRSCPPAVAEQIRQELRRARVDGLDQAAAQLADGHPDNARAALARTHIPDDPAFADLRSRARELSTKIAAASPGRGGAVAGETQAGDPEAAPGDHAAPQPVEAAEVPRPAPTAPEQASSSLCWIFTAEDLLAGQESTSWKAGGELVGLYGTLMRELPAMPDGRYQVWIQAANAKKRGTVTAMIDGRVVGKLEGTDCAELAWRPVRAALELTAGTHVFALKVNGPGWRIGGGYLAGGDRPAPEAAGTAAVSPWAPAPAAQSPVASADNPPETPETARTPPEQPPQARGTPPQGPANGTATKPVKPPEREVAAWTRSFTWPLNAHSEPLDGTVSIPSPWPSGAEPFQRSQRPPGAKQVQMLTLELGKDAVDGGGVVLLLNRARGDRKTLTVSLSYALPSTTKIAQLPKTNHATGLPEIDERVEDQPETESAPLPEIAFADSGDWQAFPIALPDLSRCSGKLWLKLEDAADLGTDRGFLLGKVATVAHAAPTPVDLGLMTAPLVAPDVTQKDYQRKLVGLLTQIAPKRSGRKWNDPRSFDARKVKLLTTNTGKEWDGEMRKQLARILGVQNPPQKIIENLALADGWWAEKQFKGPQPYVDPEEATLAVICLNGEEAGCSLKDPEALEKWMKTLIGQLVDGDQRGKRGGFLPVLVVGRTNKVDDATVQQAIDLAWMKVRDDCAASGFPLIDIRGAQVEKGKRDTRELSAQLLADGLRELQYQIAWVQRFVH